MKSNWKKVKLQNLNIEIIDGDRGKNYPKTNELLNEGYCLFLNAKNLPNYCFDFSDCKFITRDKDNLLHNGKLEIGDIVLTTRGTVGHFAYFSKNIKFKNVRINSGMIILRNTDKSISNKYLLKFFNSFLFQNQIDEMKSGSAQTQLPIKDLKKIEIIVPPLETQRKIAKILSDIDDKIELNNKINENLEQQAQAIFESIYNESNNGFLSDIIEIPESGSRPKGGALTYGIPSIGAENIEKFGIYDYSKEKFITNDYFEKMKRGKVESGDVLLYKDGAYTGKVSMALDDFPHKKCAINEHVFIVRAKPNISSQFFIYFCLDYKKNKSYLHNIASSKAAQPGLNQTELLNLPIFIPSKDKIEFFTKNVSSIMHQIAVNAKENIKLSQLRDTLLPKLMSGELDVENIDIKI